MSYKIKPISYKKKSALLEKMYLKELYKNEALYAEINRLNKIIEVKK